MFRSDDVLVTRDGAPAGFYVPWDTPDVAVEVRRATAKRSRRVAGSARAEKAGKGRRAVSIDSAPPLARSRQATFLQAFQS